MAVDVFSTDVLTAVLQSLLGNPQFLLDRYFGTTQAETSEQIHFDVLQGKRRISPFVSPLVEGQVVASQGFITNTFTPAYIKDKRVFDMNRPLKRSAGEQIGGTMAPADRLRALIAFDMQDQLNMLRRRLEVMCGEVLVTGRSHDYRRQVPDGGGRLRAVGQPYDRGQPAMERGQSADPQQPPGLGADRAGGYRRLPERCADDRRCVEDLPHRTRQCRTSSTSSAASARPPASCRWRRLPKAAC